MAEQYPLALDRYNLDDEIGRRLLQGMSDYDLLQARIGNGDEVHMPHRFDVPGNGHLVCETGVFVPAAPSDLADEHISVHAGRLYYTRSYEPFAFDGRYVGFWPDSQTAALYRFSVDVQPAATRGSARFRSAAVRAATTDHRTLHHDLDATYMTPTTTLPPNKEDTDWKVRVAVHSASAISSTAHGNPDSKDPNLHTVRVHGPVTLQVPGKLFMKIGNSATWESPYHSRPIAVEVPEDTPLQAQLKLPANGNVRSGDQGELVLEGADPYDRKHHRMIASPEQTLRLANGSLPWTDTTGDFLSRYRKALLRAARPLQGVLSDGHITRLTRVAIETALLSGTPIHPVTHGARNVLGALLSEVAGRHQAPRPSEPPVSAVTLANPQWQRKP